MRGRTRKPRKAGAFDIRVFIATLLGVYGAILLVTGLVATDEAALEKAGGVNLNVWTGLGLLVTTAVFLLWARLRPVVVPPEADGDEAAAGA